MATTLGESADLQTLAGSWHGTFRNTQLRRRGQIDFQMSATSDSAFGAVRMYGRMRGSVIEGSFTSRSEDERFESSGSWRVERAATPTR